MMFPGWGMSGWSVTGRQTSASNPAVRTLATVKSWLVSDVGHRFASVEHFRGLVRRPVPKPGVAQAGRRLIGQA